MTAAKGLRGSARPAMDRAGLSDPVMRQLYTEIHQNAGWSDFEAFADRKGLDWAELVVLISHLHRRGLIRQETHSGRRVYWATSS